MQQINVAAVQDYFRNLFSWRERRAGGIIMPNERLPWGDTTVMGLQHVLAMFGSTVLAPILMGFDANTAIFFSGIGTLLFFIITGGQIPSYLGSSFAFIGPVLTVTAVAGGFGQDPARIPYALGGIIICGLIYTLIGAAVSFFGSDWIDALMPPIVTGGVVAIIGLNLAQAGAKPLAESNMPLAIITILSIFTIAILGKGLLGRLPILLGTLVGWLVALVAGGTTAAGRDVLGIHFQGVDLAAVREAAVIGFPNFTGPKFEGSAIGLIAPVAVILVAENTGHIKAVSEMTGRNLMPFLGRGFIGDGVATMVAGFGGGTGVTTYAENIGVMAVTKVFSTAIFVIAACVAILLGFSPMFGALVMSIPAGVLGGVAVVLFGLIAAAGIRIWIDNRVDFSKGINLFLASVTLLVGTADLTMHIGDFALNGIALGTFGSIILYQIFGRLPGATDDDPGATPASAGDRGPRPRPQGRGQGQRRPRPEEAPRQQQQQRPARRPAPPPDDEFEEIAEEYAEPRPAPRPQRQQPRPAPQGQQQAQPRRRPQPAVEADESYEAPMPPPPAMPQPPTIRRSGPQEPEYDDWDDDIGFDPNRRP
ncbi:MAG: uracil-xanthine permease family protein [Thermomicrobiales bacterium]|nr:uracil-xanthine permease family protein [Thermomicrobiales bacterium]